MFENYLRASRGIDYPFCPRHQRDGGEEGCDFHGLFPFGIGGYSIARVGQGAKRFGWGRHGTWRLLLLLVEIYEVHFGCVGWFWFGMNGTTMAAAIHQMRMRSNGWRYGVGMASEYLLRV